MGISYNVDQDTKLHIVDRKGFSDDGSTGRSNNRLDGYIQDWSRYLTRRSDGYGTVDEPQIDLGLVLTGGALALGAIAVAFAVNDLNGKIDDNDDLLSTLNTD